MSDYLSAFIDQLRAAGIGPAATTDIIADDKWRQYQIEGDPKSKKAGYYRLRIDERGAVGNYGNRREGVTHNYSSKSAKEWSEEEKQAWKKTVEADRAARQVEIESAYKRVAAEANAVWNEAPDANADFPYLIKKQVAPGPCRVFEGELLVPMYDNADRLWAYQKITADGDKWYLPEARKSGLYCPLSDTLMDDFSVVCICEGFATGASIRAATGMPIFVAFDTSNLMPVAKEIHKLYPNTRIVICADNDQWQKLKPTDSERVYIGVEHAKNAGIVKARQAAFAVNGSVIWPEFPEDHQERGTDFNDAQHAFGLDYIKNRIAQAIPPQCPVATAADADSPPPPPSMDERVGGDLIEVPKKTVAHDFEVSVGREQEPEFDPADYAPVVREGPQVGDMGLPFKILGYNNGVYFYFPYRSRQIVALSAPGHTMNNLLTLASLEQWSEAFPMARGAQLVNFATNAMIRIAEERGVFQEEDRVRGCGAWIDAKRVVLHCGDRVYVDGELMDPRKITSRYVYVAAPKFIDIYDKEPLSDAEANILRQICEMPTWENKLSGMLLAGWLVIAPICAALSWRPHIWIRGQAEAGKSTIMNSIIRPVLSSVALNVDSTTTESSIRSRMGYDARPVVFDEAERAKGGQVSNMDGILTLARLASSGGTVSKFNQRPYTARSCFCFSSIHTPVKDFADETRISTMNLLKNTSPTAQQQYQDFLAIIEEHITPEFSARLLTRTIMNMKTLMQNISTIRDAARKVVKGARAAEQIAAMMGGLYLLSRTRPITPEEAEAWLKQYDWDQHTAINNENEQQRLLHHINTSLVRIAGARDYSIGELIVGALGVDDTIDAKTCDRTLRQYGIIAKTNGVTIANTNKNLGKLLKETAWTTGERGWAETLGHLPGAVKSKAGVYFGPGDHQRATVLPITFFYEGYLPETSMELITQKADEGEELPIW